MPIQLSLTQLAIITTLLLVLLAARPLWAHGPALLNLAILVAAPAAAGWAARDWRPEGRDLARALHGQLALRVQLAKLLALPQRRHTVRAHIRIQPATTMGRGR